MKILGVKIANGYSSEASLLASLLKPRDRDTESLFFYHTYEQSTGADRFECESKSQLIRLDVGWRPNPNGARPFIAKVGSHLRRRSVLPSMQRMAQLYDPDVVISSQQRWDCSLATALARSLHVPHVIYLSYPVGPMLGSDVLGRLRTCEHVVAISEFIRQDAIRHGVAPERVTTILPPRPPMDLPPAGTRERVRAEFGLPVEAQVIGIVARLDPLKGQRDSIEAFRQVARSHPTARLLVVGDKVEVSGTSREDLEAQARRTGFHDRIIFSGYRADLARVFAALDIFIHPSRREALGFAPAEASGAGLPVVAYAEGGTLEIIRHGRTGLLASPGKVDELALHLGTLLDDPSRARQMGLAGREWFGKHFQSDPACLAFLSLLAEVSRGGGDHARAAGQPVRFGIRGN